MTNPVMVTIQAAGSAPSIEEVKTRYGLTPDELDESFGVVEIDPTEHLYTILVDESAASKVKSTGDWSTRGPYSNPRIEPFGPPRSGGQ